jgi:hypothetical protein
LGVEDEDVGGIAEAGLFSAREDGFDEVAVHGRVVVFAEG